jgi:hypothetical protein
MHKLISIFLLSLIGKLSLANEIFPRTIYATTYNADSLKKIYGKNKTLLPEFELQTLIALSGYPELKEDHITFKFRHITTTGKTTMWINSVLEKDHYFIIYLTTRTKGKSVLLKEAFFNAQIGLIAHELGHIVDFKKKNTGQLITWALNVLSSKQKRAAMEKQTDLTAIQHGFGWQLYDWISYVLFNSCASEKYKKFKQRFYLQPDEIVAIINNTKSVH